MQDLDSAIRERAYYLWIGDGCPEGKADAYWRCWPPLFRFPLPKLRQRPSQGESPQPHRNPAAGRPEQRCYRPRRPAAAAPRIDSPGS